MANQIQCPSCKSFKVKVDDRTRKWRLGISMTLLGAALYYLGYLWQSAIGGFSLLFGVCFFALGIVFILLALTHKVDKATCKSCGFKFTPGLADNG
ncbi:hypothetical protein [Pedobacter jejuensis]|uniref:Uncharacterized protein n=1 Tax=Pedobacter jejuensis TaxID=1268550 RepID=A0A3N0BWB1_9SPHI|nr:hypothetical protein [Pedobacter jejuensis]RNL53766.1 hypothetical protein D7004_09520 [Pedobacter jejuensis]